MTRMPSAILWRAWVGEMPLGEMPLGEMPALQC